MKKIFSVLVGIFLALSIAMTILSGTLYAFGTVPTVMQKQMEQFAIPEKTGLPAAEYAGMASMITDYLKGKTETFQYTIDLTDGNRAVVFHDYEQQHMADCLQLFQLDRKIMIFSLGLSVILLISATAMKKEKSIAKGVLVTSVCLLTGITLIAIWGMLDFSGLFILFHQLAFDNSLWLLNPSTDMLIRLMPTDFFIDAAVKTAIIWIAGICIMMIVSACVMRKGKRK